MTPELLEALCAARAEARRVVLATRLPGGGCHILPDPAAGPRLNEEAAAMAPEECRLVSIEDEQWFLQAEAAPPGAILVGAVHITQSLAPLLMALDYAVTVIDPRRSLATDERFPGVRLLSCWPDEALAELLPRGPAALVALSHDPKLDDPALDAALHAGLAYIGALGSRRSHAARLKRLAALGHDEAALARVRGPVGLSIGAATPAEIALSIAAEIVAVRRGAALTAKA